MASDHGLTITAYKIPISTVAGWPTSNFVNPVTRTWLVPFASVLHALVTLLLAARLWMRWTRKAGKIGADDFMIILAWMLAVVFTGTAIYGVQKANFDKHVWDVHPNRYSRAALVAWIADLLFIISTSLTKISILLFHYRLISRTQNTMMKWLINIGIALVISTCLFFFLWIIFVCSPVSASWNSFDPTYTKSYKCYNRHITDPLNGVFSIATDIYALLLPELLIKSLQMTGQQKIILYSVFGCNILTVGAGIARTVWLARLSTGQQDLTWDGYEVYIWTLLEMHLAMVCASAPALKAFFGVYVVQPISRVTTGGNSSGISRPYHSKTMQVSPPTTRNNSTAQTTTQSKLGSWSEVQGRDSPTGKHNSKVPMTWFTMSSGIED